jgi:hypothetical protein
VPHTLWIALAKRKKRIVSSSESRDRFVLEFFRDDDGKHPVLDWIKKDLSFTKRAALGHAMREILQVHGVQVCKTEWGKQLGHGVFEFRLRMAGSQVINEGWGTETKIDVSEQILLRVFCHAYGDQIVLLLAGYDKGDEPSSRRQQRELALARQRLTLHKAREAAAKKAQRPKRK